MATSHESLSKQSRRRTSWIFAIMGLAILILFMLVLCSREGEQQGNVSEEETSGLTLDTTFGDETTSSSLDVPKFETSGAQLSVTPKELSLDNVVLGAQAEGILTLRAEKGPVVFEKMSLAETTSEGFSLAGSCAERTQLNKDEECILKVLWEPTIVQTVQNTLTISWREDSGRVYDYQRALVQVKASSTDSKECVCCEIEKEKAEKVRRKVVTKNGVEIEINDDGTVTIDGKKYPIIGDVVFDEDGNLIAIIEPERIALGLNNEYLGRVTDTRTVVDKEGKTLGRLLGDDTLVDSDFNVLGMALPLVSVIDAQGMAVGKMVANESGVRVVNAKNEEIGTPRVDRTVVDKAGIQVGMLRPWGVTLDLSGDFLGVILPDGRVVDAKSNPVGSIQQNGFVFDEAGNLVGGLVPAGLAVGTGCHTYGTIGFNGQVKDEYGQIIGRVMLDGGVVDSNFNEIGQAVTQGLVVDMKGSVLGFVNSAGKAVDGKGKLIGCVAPNGTVSAGKKALGGVLPKGMVIANACSVVGSVYPNGKVMSHSVQEVGVMRPDGYAINSSKNVIGAVVPKGTVLGESCHLVGTISVTGHVVNNQKMSVGCVNMQHQALDTDGREIGKITATGPVVNADGVVVGRARYDGRIIDKEGKIVDCENPDGTSSVGVVVNNAPTGPTGNGSSAISAGVIKNDKGESTNWTVLANEVFNEQNEKIGTIDTHGLITNKKGEIIGFIPPDGVIISNTGNILGSYNRRMGAATDMNGEDLGYVMPDLTVLDLKKAKILGALLPQDTVFANLDGEVLGHLTLEGKVVNDAGQSLGRVLADGSLYNADNVLIGGSLFSGIVFSANGNQVGVANANGDVLMKGTRVANLLPNGLAVTPDSRVVGRVWNPLSVVVAAQGVVGTVVSRAKGSDGTTYQAAVFDKSGNYLGTLSPFGVLLGTDGQLGGMMVPITMVADWKNNFIGWVDFKGQVINASEQVIGQLNAHGVVIDAEGKLIGSVIHKGTVVDSSGSFVGHVGPDGQIYNGNGVSDFVRGRGSFAFNKDASKSARLLADGLAFSSSGQMLGWTGFDGQIMNAKQRVGKVASNNRLMSDDGQVEASYVVLGAPSVQEKEKMCGIVDETGTIIGSNGRTVGTLVAPDFAVQKNTILGRILSQSLFVRDIITDELVGVTNLNGLVYRPNTQRQTGTFMMNGLVADAAKQVLGGLVAQGAATSVNLKTLGTEDLTGAIWSDDKLVGVDRGTGIVTYNNIVTGGVFAPEVIVDKVGRVVGRTNVNADVINQKGQKIGSRMAFSSVLTPETIWVGGPIRTGTIVDDRAHKVGVVAGDGSVIYDSLFKGRILPDGSVAGVTDRAIFNAMPYIGHLAVQGLPMSYEGTVLGRTTIHGNIVDASDKVIYQMLDDGSVLGKERPLEGRVLPFVPAISREGAVFGMLNGNGKLVDATGNEVGRVASNGAVKGGSEIENLGALMPDTLVVHDCKVIGQTAYNGDVIDGKGNVVAHMQMDRWAEDSKGKRIGRAVSYGPVMSPATPAVYLGRTMPDSTIVDPSGIIIGCVRDNGEAVKIQNIREDGTVEIGDDPEVIGHQVTRGPVIDEDGNIKARIDSVGHAVSPTGEVIGYIRGDGSNRVFTFQHEEIGRGVSEFEELLFDPEKGTVRKTFDLDGILRNTRGDFEFQVTRDRRIVDQFGNEIGTRDDAFTDYVYLYDMQNKPVARLNNCVLNRLPAGEKMGNLLANGEIRDDAQELILTAAIDNKVYNPDGTQFGYFGGLGLDLRRCGMSEANASGATRKIVWGGKTYEIDPVTGMIIDPATGQVVGNWDDVSKQPYIWDVYQGGGTSRPVPPVLKGISVPQEVIEKFRDDLDKRRSQMKQKIGGTGSTILPHYNVTQMAQSGKSNDWSSVGVSKSNISTWPVDMSHVLLADKAIPAVLQRSIDSRYPDVPVTAIVERHIYGEAGRNILIPAGSRLIGSATSDSGVFGADQAAKINISWTRLIRPDGAAFKFEGISGDAQGRGGVSAYLDLQLLKKFGLPFVSTLGEGLVLKLTELNDNQSISGTSAGVGDSTMSETPGHQTRKMFIDNFKAMWGELMDMAGEIPNIVYVPAGTRLIAFSSEDLWLRSDDDPAENGAGGAIRAYRSEVSVSGNDSWTRQRSQENTQTETQNQTTTTNQNNQSNTQNSTQQNNTPPESETVYAPEPVQPSDLDNREVKPVAPQKERPAYF